MVHRLWAVPVNRRQLAIKATAMVFSLIVASTMFFTITALTATGDEYDCGPAAYALFAGPSVQTNEVADCQMHAQRRLTTVVGLVVLACIGSAMGWRLFDTPIADRRHVEPRERPLPDDLDRLGRRPRNKRLHADGVIPR